MLTDHGENAQSPERRDVRRPRRTYLDHAATSPLRPCAAQAMADIPALGNPSAVHGSGRAARAMLEDAREEIAALLGVRPLEIILTSGGTEADALAILGGLAPQGRLWASSVEHPAVAGLADPRLLGQRVSTVPVDGHGVVDLAGFAGGRGMGDGRGPWPGDVVSLMMVNNETGAVQPVAEMARMAHDAGALAHTDAVQAFGHIDVNPVELGVDLISISAHKIGGPVGIGALWVRRGVNLAPITAGGMQQAQVRSGTQAVMLARGFAAAARQAVENLDRDRAQWQTWHDAIVAEVGGLPGVHVDDAPQTSPSICHLTIDRVRATDLLLVLDSAGIDCSAGSACQAGVARPSSTMLAMGRSVDEAQGGLRISMGHTTTRKDIEQLLDVLPGAIETVRGAR